MTHTRRVDFIIDGKKITSKAQDIELRIDGVNVYSTSDRYHGNQHDVKDLEWRSIKSLLKTADSAFSHSTRFRIIKSLAEFPKRFTEIKNLLSTTSATTDFHLKTLNRGMIIFKDENGKYALTLLGELVLNYFSNFLKEARDLQKEL